MLSFELDGRQHAVAGVFAFRANLPLTFHPTGITASAVLEMSVGAAGAAGRNARHSFCVARKPVVVTMPADTVAAGSMAVIEPVDPFERGELHGFEVASRSSPMGDTGFANTTDGSIPASASRSEWRMKYILQIQPVAAKPKHGGVYCEGQTATGAINVAEMILARATVGVAA